MKIKIHAKPFTIKSIYKKVHFLLLFFREVAPSYELAGGKVIFFSWACRLVRGTDEVGSDGGTTVTFGLLKNGDEAVDSSLTTGEASRVGVKNGDEAVDPSLSDGDSRGGGSSGIGAATWVRAGDCLGRLGES